MNEEDYSEWDEKLDNDECSAIEHAFIIGAKEAQSYDNEDLDSEERAFMLGFEEAS